MLRFSIMSLRRARAHTVLSTMMVRTRSPTSAVSPPVRVMSTPYERIFSTNICEPSITAAITSPGMRVLLRPMVEESIMSEVMPTHSRSSVFITMASCAMPCQTLISPVSFQYT